MMQTDKKHSCGRPANPDSLRGLIRRMRVGEPVTLRYDSIARYLSALSNIRGYQKAIGRRLHIIADLETLSATIVMSSKKYKPKRRKK